MSKLAICFPGQGSQRVGMGKELSRAFPEAAEVYEQASDELGFDLGKLCFDGPIDQLSQTELTQPALVATSLAALRALQARIQLVPHAVVGHSVGEHAVQRVCDRARDLGAKAVRLRVSGAFHSPLVADAAHRLEPAVRAVRFRDLRTRFMSTVSNKLETVDRVPGLLVEQLTTPVRFTQSVQGLLADGVRTFVEVGAGSVLSGLVKRIDSSVTAVSVAAPDDFSKVEESLGGA